MPAILGIAGMMTFSASTFSEEALVVSTPVKVQKDQTSILPIGDSPISFFEPNPQTTVEVDTIEVGENGTLILPPFESIVINHLIAHEGAKIQIAHSSTSNDGAKARFFVKELTGHIVLEARGAKGRDGRSGRHGRQGLPGERGRNARTLLFGLFYLSDGENGRMGYPGEDGEDGEDGENGGLGGEIYFYYQLKSADSKILIDSSGGEAGLAGKAGLGGFGGNGGIGGEGINDGKQGPMGPRGRSGRAGRPGQPGLPGKAAMYQLPAVLFQCLMGLEAMASVHELSEEDFEMCRDQNPVPPKKDSKKIQPIIIQSGDLIHLSEEEGVSIVSADGQDGRNSWMPGPSGSTPENGTSATHGGNVTIFIKDLPSKLVITSRGGNGGNGANATRGARGQNGEDGRDGGLFRSAKPGTNATDGQDGGNGSDGGAGGQGGKIQIVYVPDPETYNENWVEHIALDIAGGSGGKSGVGAVGGKGGVGGIGGKKFLSKKREDDGLNGRDGRSGHDGRDGMNGEEGSYLLLEANSMTDWIIEEYKNSLGSF